MKRVFLMILTIAVLVCCFTGCNNNNKAEEVEKEEVTLTAENIENYLSFEGNFIDGETHNVMGIMSVSTAKLDFQTFPTKSGSFENVEVTMIVESDDGAFTNTLGDWTLEGKEDSGKIEITFKLSTDGKFSKKYNVTCDYNGQKLDGEATFKIVSVSGTFRPN